MMILCYANTLEGDINGILCSYKKDKECHHFLMYNDLQDVFTVEWKKQHGEEWMLACTNRVWKVGDWLPEIGQANGWQVGDLVKEWQLPSRNAGAEHTRELCRQFKEPTGQQNHSSGEGRIQLCCFQVLLPMSSNFCPQTKPEKLRIVTKTSI